MENSSSHPRRRSTVTASSADFVGQTFGDFRILSKLGEGGMGHVYLAEQISLKRKVAIKMLRDGVSAKSTSLARFQAESTTIAKLNHANIVQAFMVGKHDGQHYLVMEYVEGMSLNDYIVRKGPLDAALVVTIMRQVAHALERAGELGIVHRDIKPANILLTRKGEAKVADFGLARCLSAEERVDLTRAGATVGTPLYMSPEQIKGKELDCRSDIYSLGVACYQMLTGRLPFDGANAFQVANQHVNDEPEALATIRPDLPPALCNIVHKMMAKKRSARYASARELLNDISVVRKSMGAATQTISIGDTQADAPAPKVVPLWQRPLWLAGAGVMAFLGIVTLAIAGVALAWYGHLEQVVEHPIPAAPVQVAQEVPKLPEPPPDAVALLRPKVDQLLKEPLPSPLGVETCIDLGVLYLDQEKAVEAEALFKQMTKRKPPSPYYFIGRLGLAVTDTLNDNDKASHAKLKEVFDAKAKDNRLKIVDDYLTKKPEFAAWVNDVDAKNVRAEASERPPQPKTTTHRPSIFRKLTFRK